MTPAVYPAFSELRQSRRLDTNRVFLYKEKPIHRVGTAFKAACRRAGISNLRIQDFRHTASTNLQTSRRRYGNRNEDRRPQIRPNASAL